jgi:hypothetical protein
MGKHQGKSFTIRVAAKHKQGVQRDMLGCLHSAGLDVLQVSVYAVDHPSSALGVGAFVASYVVLPRGKKKDYDDEKLEEIHHHLMEVLDDEDSQIMFEPYDDDFSKDGIIEIQVHVTYHPDILHEITDELAKMALTVMKAEHDHSTQPVHGHTNVGIDGADSAMHRIGSDGAFEAESPVRRKASEGNLVSEASARAIGAVSSTGGAAFFALQEVSREVFYAREADSTHQFSQWRRAEIQGRIEQIIHNHELKGTVIVRILHQHEMKISKVLPKINNEERVVVLKCTGTHHVDLLHEICDILYEQEFDVLHSMLDTNDQGTQEHIMHIERNDTQAMNPEQRLKLRRSIEAIYAKHNMKEGYYISVRPMVGGSAAELREQRSGENSLRVSRRNSPDVGAWANIPTGLQPAGPPVLPILGKAEETTPDSVEGAVSV